MYTLTSFTDKEEVVGFDEREKQEQTNPVVGLEWYAKCDSMESLRKALYEFGEADRREDRQHCQRRLNAELDAELEGNRLALIHAHQVTLQAMADANAALYEASHNREEAALLRVHNATNLALQLTPSQGIKRVCTFNDLMFGSVF